MVDARRPWRAPYGRTEVRPILFLTKWSTESAGSRLGTTRSVGPQGEAQGRAE